MLLPRARDVLRPRHVGVRAEPRKALLRSVLLHQVAQVVLRVRAVDVVVVGADVLLPLVDPLLLGEQRRLAGGDGVPVVEDEAFAGSFGDSQMEIVHE